MIRLVLAALLCVVCSSASYARPSIKHLDRQIVDQAPGCSDPVMRPCYLQVRASVDQVSRRLGQVRPRTLPPGLARVMAEGAGRAVFGSDLVSRARAYLGTNPTGWRRLWCARFMAMLAPAKAARLRNPNEARAWLHAGPHLGGCQVGAIAVMSRRGGGHVGIVTSCGPHGPTVVSGNHGHRVGEGQYSASRVLAYVSAS